MEKSWRKWGRWGRPAAKFLFLLTFAAILGALVGFVVRSSLGALGFFDSSPDRSNAVEHVVASDAHSQIAHSDSLRKRDWADSLSLPSKVRPPLASAEAIPPEALAVAKADPDEPEPARPIPVPEPVYWTGPVLIAQRVAADRSRVTPLNHDRFPGNVRQWSILGDCTNTLEVEHPDIGGRERGRIGEWIFALAVPGTACNIVQRHSAKRISPSVETRRLLAYATEVSPVVRSLGASAFAPEELVELASYSANDRLFVWGVFRRPLRTTQVIPPPPRPQLAFVAEIRSAGMAEILWARYAISSAETLAFAGAWETPGGSLEGYFGVRSTEGNRLLRVTPQPDGSWVLQGIRPLGL